MDCLNCDNDNHGSSLEDTYCNHSETELKQLLAKKKRQKAVSERREKYNQKIQKKIDALKKRLK